MATINGTGASETLAGTADADVINGLGGNDTINALTRPAGPGAIDIVDGGAGNDTLVVNAAAETEAVQLFAGGSPRFSVRSISGNFSVDAFNVERVQFTGGSGNDFINSDTAGGTVNGGGGIDHWQADLGALAANVVFTLGATTAINAAGLTSILNLERITLTTGSGNDNIVGAARSDIINTGSGNDTIDAKARLPGASPLDFVDGGADVDTLVVDASTETLGVQLFAGGAPRFLVRSDSGRFGVDAFNVERVRFTGGSGNDSINTDTAAGTVNGGGGIDHWQANLAALTTNVVFTLGATTAIAAAGLTSILGLERITLTTGSGNDNVTGGGESDSITTGAGNDLINAKTRMPGAAPLDFVDGGAGADTLIVDASAETLGVQLFAGGAPRFSVRSDSGNVGVDAFNVENIRFTAGAGDDVINTDTAAGTVNGGAGVDHWQANLAALASNVAFTLGTTTAIAAAGLTSILGLERITLTTGSGNDNIVGGGRSDSITTSAGNDTIDAGARIPGGLPFDFVDGGVGSDTLIVNASAETLGVQLFAGGAPRFAVRSDSGRFGVDAFNVERVQFTGGAGNDVINTDTAAGSVDGGGGIDHWQANLAALATNVVFTLGTTTAIAAAGLTSLLDLERISLTTGSGNDNVIGGGQSDSIVTGGGNDIVNVRTRIPGPSPLDFADGGAGSDLLIVDAAAETLGVQLFAGGSPTFALRSDSGEFGADAFSFERVRFTGGTGDDNANGAANNDTIATGAGDDSLSGGAGNDTLTSTSGNDVFFGGLGADQMTCGAGRDLFDYDLAVQSSAANGIDSISDFSAAFDTFDLSGIDANSLAGGDQAFTFVGSAAFSGAAGELRAVAGLVEADVDGNGAADFAVSLGNGALAGAANFIL
jgi:Ca2+-binding RTX toxin-like protein